MPAWLTARVIVGLLVALLVVFMLVWGPAACNRIRSLTAQNRVNEAQHGALLNSAMDAVETAGNVAEAAQDSEALTRRNAEEIRNAQGAGDRVNPDVHNAGLRALCRRAAYRDNPACRVQQPDPQ